MLDFRDEKGLDGEAGAKTWDLQSIPLNLRCFFKHCLDAESKGATFSCEQKCRGGKPETRDESDRTGKGRTD